MFGDVALKFISSRHVPWWNYKLSVLGLESYYTYDLFFLQELGHFLAAVPKKVKLSIPYFIPNITLGSFGAITQVIFLIMSFKFRG